MTSQPISSFVFSETGIPCMFSADLIKENFYFNRTSKNNKLILLKSGIQACDFSYNP